MIKMSELRLIDANAFQAKMKKTNRYFSVVYDLEEMPTIDPETLPIVKELRAKLADYEQAEQKGRLMVLPCKVCDKVRVCTHAWGNTWNYNVHYFNGEDFLVGEIVAIIKTRRQLLMKISVEHNVSWKRPTKRFPISALGKTVFLISKEAEAVL